jgi:hypothetical protein
MIKWGKGMQDLEKKPIIKITFAAFLVFLISCGSSKAPEPSEITRTAFSRVLQENDKVIESIIKDGEKVPDLSALLTVVENGKSVVVEAGLKRALEEEGRILQDASKKGKDEFYEAYSRFAEHLSVSMTTGGVTLEDYNRFYCPMVSKYWLAKGTEILNPFAPEMRDCGEIKN